MSAPQAPGMARRRASRTTARDDGRIPREHLLADGHGIRAVPRDKRLDDIFLHRETRKVRKDGT